MLAPNTFSGEGFAVPQPLQATLAEPQLFDKHASKARGNVFPTAGGGMGIGAVIGGMEANGVRHCPSRSLSLFLISVGTKNTNSRWGDEQLRVAITGTPGSNG